MDKLIRPELVDISKIRSGDEVMLMPFRVKEVNSNNTLVHVWMSPNSSNYFTADQIFSHYPKLLERNNRIRCRSHNWFGTVLAVDYPEAWVKFDGRDRHTWPISDLEVVDDNLNSEFI